MTSTTRTASAIIRPEEVRALLIEPTMAAATAATVSTVIYTRSPGVRVPRSGALDVAEWTPEGEEIPLGDLAFTEQAIDTRRLTGGSVLTQELVEDSSPEAAALVGQELARDLARSLDRAYFGAKTPGNTEQPLGLRDHLAEATTITATGTLTVEPFIDGQQAAEEHGHAISGWIAHPKTITQLAREFSKLNGAMSLDVSQPLRQQLLGAAYLPCLHIPEGEVWAIDRANALLVVRTEADIERDASVFFTSYRIALRARIRVGFGWLNPAANIRIILPTT